MSDTTALVIPPTVTLEHKDTFSAEAYTAEQKKLGMVKVLMLKDKRVQEEVIRTQAPAAKELELKLAALQSKLIAEAKRTASKLDKRTRLKELRRAFKLVGIAASNVKLIASYSEIKEIKCNTYINISWEISTGESRYDNKISSIESVPASKVFKKIRDDIAAITAEKAKVDQILMDAHAKLRDRGNRMADLDALVSSKNFSEEELKAIEKLYEDYNKNGHNTGLIVG